jgi:hypothetical protein
MASMKRTTSEDRNGKPVLVLGGDGVDGLLVEAKPLYEAFKALTGVDPRDPEAMARPGVRHALNLIAALVASVAKPTPALVRWRDSIRPFELSSDRRHAAIVKAVQWRQSVGFMNVRGFCGTIEPAFLKLSDAQEAEALRHLKGPRSVLQVVARLSLACGAFGHKRGTSEGPRKAIARVANQYRQALARLSPGG